MRKTPPTNKRLKHKLLVWREGSLRCELAFISLTMAVNDPASDHMEDSPHTFPPGNASLSSSVLSLCPTAATLFFLPSAYALLFLTALPGNALSLWVLLRRISTVSPTHVYLSHLSISNLILSLMAPFLAGYYARGSVWSQSDLLCQLVLHGITPVLHVNIYLSLLILTCVAVSRFAALIRHTHASRPSTCTTLLPHGFFARLTRTSFAGRVCFAVWVVVVGGTVPVTVYYSVSEAGGTGRAAEKGGCVEVCYNPAVEIGAGLSAALTVPVISMFFVFYLLLLLSYMTVLKHIRRSRHSTNVSTSHSLLGRVLRNIVVIQVVLSVCLLPYHIFKPIFISLARDDRQLTHPPGPNIRSLCHPLSTFVEVKNCLFLLAALRGSTDPLMYFLLDKTFRHQTLRMLRCGRCSPGSRPTCPAAGDSGHLGDGNAATATADLSHECIM